MKFSPEELRCLLELLDITDAEEIDCGEFLDRVAGYLERLGPGGTPPPGCESIVHHLRICPECTEEFDALYRAFQEGLGEQEPEAPES